MKKLFLLNLIKSYSIFFDYFPLETIFSEFINRSIGFQTLEKNFLIDNIVFSYLIEHNDGGAISFSQFSNLKLLIYYCSFKFCNVIDSQYGGALFFKKISQSNIIIAKICSIRCSSPQSQFSYFEFSDSNSILIFQDVALSNFYNVTYESSQLISIYGGLYHLNNINLSFISLIDFSGFYLSNLKQFQFKYLTFYEVFSFNQIVNSFSKINDISIISEMNFISNKNGNSSQFFGFFFFNSYFSINFYYSNFIFLENSILFENIGTTVNFINCSFKFNDFIVVSESNLLNFYGNLSFSNIINISHYYSNICIQPLPTNTLYIPTNNKFVKYFQYSILFFSILFSLIIGSLFFYNKFSSSFLIDEINLIAMLEKEYG